MTTDEQEKSFYKQAVRSTVTFLNSFIETDSTESDEENVRKLGLKRQKQGKKTPNKKYDVVVPQELAVNKNKSVYKNAKTSKAVKASIKKELNKASSNVEPKTKKAEKLPKTKESAKKKSSINTKTQKKAAISKKKNSTTQ